MLYDPRAFVYTLRVYDSFGPEGAHKIMLGMCVDDVRRLRCAMDDRPHTGMAGRPRMWEGFFMSFGGGSSYGDRDWWWAWLRTLDARGLC
jgi:hypothetical protein